jgi:hypothetical protein
MKAVVLVEFQASRSNTVAATGLGLSAIPFSGILNPQYENAYMILVLH